MRSMNLMIGQDKKILINRVIQGPTYYCTEPPSGYDPRIEVLTRKIHVPLIKTSRGGEFTMFTQGTLSNRWGIEKAVDIHLSPNDLLVNLDLSFERRLEFPSVWVVSNDKAVSLLEGAELHETCVIQLGDGTFLTDCPGDCGLPSDECSKWIYKTKDILKAKCFEREGEAQKRIQYRNLRGCKIMPRAAQLSFRSVY